MITQLAIYALAGIVAAVAAIGAGVLLAPVILSRAGLFSIGAAIVVYGFLILAITFDWRWPGCIVALASLPLARHLKI